MRTKHMTITEKLIRNEIQDVLYTTSFHQR